MTTFHKIPMLYRSLLGVAALCLVAAFPSEGQETPQKEIGGSGTFSKLVWSDEFDYEGLPDPKKWNYETGYLRNRESQYYTKERRENAEVKNGHLTITAIKDNFQIGDKTYPITSASLTTQGKGFWNRGRIEVRAKMPCSLGTWPAFFMFPNDYDYQLQSWPKCGEIDIVEHVGWIPKKVHFHIHVEKYNHMKRNDKGIAIDCNDPDTAFHVYALEWFDDRMDFYFDDKKVLTYVNEGEGEDQWPFKKPFFLIMCLAFGGGWGANGGVDDTTLPQRLEVDYVRVWQ